MKLSELLQELSTIKENCGDVDPEVMIWDSEVYTLTILDSLELVKEQATSFLNRNDQRLIAAAQKQTKVDAVILI